MTRLGRAALDAIRFPPETLDALVAAIDINDVVDLAARLPATVRIDYPAEHFVQGFALSRQLWQEGFDWRSVAAMAGRVRRGADLDADERRAFKQVRARFKHLRFAFYLYGAEHRSPPMLSLVTLVMGELQDALRVRGPVEVRRQASRLQLLLAGPGRLVLMREADRIRPSDPDGFRRFVLAQVASLRPMLAGANTGAHAFHAARKVVSRQVSFHDDMRTLFPSEEHRAMARWLATLNGMMGQFHDGLVAGHASGASDYRRDRFVLPEPIRERLASLCDLYLGTSSSWSPDR